MAPIIDENDFIMRYFTREGGGGTFRVCGWNWGGCYFVDFVELLSAPREIEPEKSTGLRRVELWGARLGHVVEFGVPATS